MLFTNLSRLLLGSSVTLLSLAALVGKTQPAKAIDITFDYTYDTNNFFTGANASRQNLLNDAASYFEGFTDQLSPVAERTYDILTNPSDVDQQDVSVTTAVAQNEIKIYVGSDLDLSSIGLGGLITFGSTARGQTGAPASDVEPVIGFISFKDYGGENGANNDSQWHFGTTTVGLTGTTKNDFLSTAIHEIAHVMGFGTSDSWDNLVSGSNQFLGAKSNQIYGGNVPLSADLGHWQDGLESQVKGLTDPQETAMDPTLTVGERKFLTDLDYAGLQDIGWEVNSSAYSSSVPFEFSPSWGILIVAGMFGTKKVWNARKVKQSAVE